MTRLRPLALLATLLLAACGADREADVAAAPAPAAAPVAPAPVVAPQPMLTEAQVHAVLDQVEAATRKHDAAALGQAFTDDAKFTVTPYQMPMAYYGKDEYLAYVRKQFARNAGAQESHKLVKLVIRTDGGQATARESATTQLEVNGYPLAQVDDQFYTVELRDGEPKVVALVIQGQGVTAGGHP
jgi:hypothetical protein